MLKNILDMLKLSPAFNVSEEVEIAKGKYAIARTYSDAWKKIKREFKYTKK